MIQSSEALVACLETLGELDRVGLDVEGDGLYRYRSRLCIIQVGGAEDVAVIDALAIEDLSPLAPLLSEDGPEKVVHDVSFDRKMLASRGLPLGRVFDTAVAARFLGEPSTGLSALLAKHFDVELDKRFQQSDWGERPLDEERLAYLTNDVRHLSALADTFIESARALDILEEIDLEALYAMERALEPEKRWAPWTRVKGARDLGAHQRAVLRALADVREAEAEARDVPPFRIASNRVLYEAARRRPRRVKDLRRVRGLRKLRDEQLAEILERAERDGPPNEEPKEAPLPPEVRAERKVRAKALTTWRAAEAETRGVEVQVVLPGHCLRDLAGLTGTADLTVISGLGAKRIERYREVLLGLIRDASAQP